MNILEEIQKIREENNNSRQKSQFLERSIFGGKQKKIERKFHTSGLLQIHWNKNNIFWNSVITISYYYNTFICCN